MIKSISRIFPGRFTTVYFSTMNTENAETFEYTEKDFIHQTAPWVDKTAPQYSRFDREVLRLWDKAMDAGVFRYGIDHIITRILPGPKHYVGQLNTLRATERRKPQEISSVNQPFNPKAFNFKWVKSEEVIFDLKNVTEKHIVNKAYGGRGTEGQEECNGFLTNGVVQEKGDAVHQASSESSVSKEDHSHAGERHTLIVNVSPMEYGHCLLLPQIDIEKPQVLTCTALEVAIETMLLSRHRGLRMGFNSLCAFASVNHLHFHFYYLEHELIVDYAPVRHLAGKYFEFTTIPCPGFALQLHGTTVSEMARMSHRITNYFHEKDIAHNIFMCRGSVFGEERNSSLQTIRLFIWPRRKFIGKKSSEEFNVACIELGGHLPIKEVEGYHKLTEADVDAIIRDACLPPGEYDDIKQVVLTMGREEEQKMKQNL